MSPEQELVRGLLAGSRPSMQKWHRGFSSTFAPSLVEVGHVAAEEPHASRKGGQSGYPMAWAENKVNQELGVTGFRTGSWAGGFFKAGV